MGTANAKTHWQFVLYKAGDQPVMENAERTLRRLCDQYLDGDYTLEVVDLADPSVPVPPQVLVLPTVVRTSPAPERRLIGDLSQTDKAVEWLGLKDAQFGR